jgi:hypothetical protein
MDWSARIVGTALLQINIDRAAACARTHVMRTGATWLDACITIAIARASLSIQGLVWCRKRDGGGSG